MNNFMLQKIKNLIDELNYFTKKKKEKKKLW